MDIKKIREQAKALSNMGENACPLPELVDMPRGAQWERFLIKIDEMGFTLDKKGNVASYKDI